MENVENYRHKPKTCTDTSWICLFFTFWCFLIVIIVFSISYGCYDEVIHGADSFGNICNQKHNKHYETFNLSAYDTSNRPFLLYFDITNLKGVVRMCVEECPTQKLGDFTDIAKLSTSPCRYDIDRSKAVLDPLYELYKRRRGPCPLRSPKCSSIRNRCVGLSLKFFVDEFYKLLNSGGLDQMFFVAVYQVWFYVGILCGFAFVVSIVLLAMMFWLTKIVSWIVCSLTIISNVALCVQLWLTYDFAQHKEVITELPLKEEGEPEKEFYIYLRLLDDFMANNILILVLGILTTFSSIILTVSILNMMKHLKRLKLLFNEAVACIKHLPGLGVAPILALLGLMLFIPLSGYTFLCLTTAKYPVRVTTREKFYIDDVDDLQHLRMFYHIEFYDSKPLRRTFGIFLIGAFWTTEFIFAFEEFCIGVAVAYWYFRPSISSPSLQAYGVLLKYHLGTISKGSAVITLLKIPRLIFSIICRRLKKKVNQKWQQRLQFLEEHIKIYTHNAYAPAAMETTDYRPAATVAFKIFTRNASQVESINQIFDYVIFLSKYLVAILTCLVGIIFFKDKQDYDFIKDTEKFFFFMAPVIFSTCCAFCIAHVVFSIFEMTVDMLILCVCEEHLMYGELRHKNMKCKLSKLLRTGDRGHIQIVKVKAVQRQPFRSRN